MVQIKERPDYVLIIITGFLIFFGIIVLASASTYILKPTLGETFYFLIHQIIFGLIPGILLAVILYKIPLGLIKKKAILLLLLNLILMLMVFLPIIGKKSGESARWIVLGPISIQPSELLKLTFILYLASWLESRSEKTSLVAEKGKLPENLLAFLAIIVFIAFILYQQSDISTFGVIAATGTLMYLFAKTPFWHTLAIILLGVVGAYLLITAAPYRINRVKVLLDPENAPSDTSYQIRQSMIAVGSGKIFGLGLGMSQQKFGLPHPISDSIFALLAEETGFLGAAVLILLFLLFLWRGFKIGKETNNIFYRLSALGITSWIMLQALINIASMIGVFPLTGIPLPFISSGGSALIAELGGLGILLNISKQGN